ncbi:hypothetical protein LINPERPRIM_LOCUS29500 [Linum perenne]
MPGSLRPSASAGNRRSEMPCSLNLVSWRRLSKSDKFKFRGRRVSWVGLLSTQMGRSGVIVGEQRRVDYCETWKGIVCGHMLSISAYARSRERRLEVPLKVFVVRGWKDLGKWKCRWIHRQLWPFYWTADRPLTTITPLKFLSLEIG